MKLFTLVYSYLTISSAIIKLAIVIYYNKRLKGEIIVGNYTECNHKFTFYDRLKCILNLTEHLKCTKCNSIYKPKANVYRGIYIFTILILNIFVFNNIITLNDFMLKIKLQILIIIVTFPLFDLLPHRWHRYEKIN